jgi:hypothetical protein
MASAARANELRVSHTHCGSTARQALAHTDETHLETCTSTTLSTPATASQARTQGARCSAAKAAGLRTPHPPLRGGLGCATTCMRHGMRARQQAARVPQRTTQRRATPRTTLSPPPPTRTHTATRSTDAWVAPAAPAPALSARARRGQSGMRGNKPKPWRPAIRQPQRARARVIIIMCAHHRRTRMLRAPLADQ